MQVGDMEEALAEIGDAVQAMGWAAAEQVIMKVAQEVLQTAEDGVDGASSSGAGCSVGGDP